MTARVVLDACVLVPAALRDTLLRAAVRNLYQFYWSAEILAEIERVLVREGMTTADKARYLVDTLRSAFPSAMPPAEYRRLIPDLEIDEKDRHVLAAAIHTGAELIVTENIRHFPDVALAPHAIAAQTPDAFLIQLFEQDPDGMCESIEHQARALRRGAFTVADILDNLSRNAPRFAAIARAHMARR